MMSSRSSYTFKQGLTAMAAKALRIDPDLAVEAGENAALVMNLIRRAMKVRGASRDGLLHDARREIGRINNRRYSELVEALRMRLFEVSGQEGASVNPATGVEEFFWPFDQLKSAASRVGRALGIGSESAQPPDDNGIEPIYVKAVRRHEKLPQSILRTEAERRKVILENGAGRISIKDSIQGPWKPSFEPLGRTMVGKYSNDTERIAREEGVDPDLVKTVMHAENARGHKFGLDYLADALGKSSSVHPMNINPSLWSGLGIDKVTAYDPKTNIRAATRLIGRTWDRLDEPTVSKLVTLYQGLGQDRVSEYGAYGQRVYDERRWERRPVADTAATGYRGR